MELALGHDQRPITVSRRNAHRRALRPRLEIDGGPQYTCICSIPTSTATRPEDRELTARLYGGDQRVRIRQELLLGVGGVRALRALGIVPGVLHLNEGHSAFAGLEMVRQRMEREGIGFEEARRRVARQVVFTTHTPVPAGHDRFSDALIEEHLGPLRDALGLSSRPAHGARDASTRTTRTKNSA